MNISEIQKALQLAGIDGWLFADFRGRDYIAYRVLDIKDNHLATRRWFYFIPANGEPVKLVHKIEDGKLSELPGKKMVYLPWKQLNDSLKEIVGSCKNIAMQYSPNNAIPYISLADAGIVELIRSFGIEVVSSGNLVSQFEAFLDEKDRQSHIEASTLMQKIKDDTFIEIGNRIKAGNNPTEYEIMIFMHEQFKANNLFFDHGPIVGVNEHAADPHFEPTPENSFTMKNGDLVLIDLFARLDKPNSIWYDITWMGYIGENIPAEIQKIWEVNRDARDAGLQLVKDRFASGKPLMGCEIDEATRKVIIEAGYGEWFTHRTGHNISTLLHGNGAHCDNLETKDERLIIKGSCFSIEPGIYIPEKKIGFRTEIDVFVTESGEVEVHGAIQEELVKVVV